MPELDLHTHSTASDGTDSPRELVRKASKQGIKALALTDHDTIGALEEASREAKIYGIEFIRGCEMSTVSAYGRFHVLGLWLPENCRLLDDFLEDMRQRRDRRNELIVQRFQEQGVDITMAEVKAKATCSVGRPHFAAVLLDKGVVQSKREAFDVWLGNEGRAYVARKVPTTQEMVRLLADAGASPVIAHPLLKSSARSCIPELAAELKPLGLFGLEAWHSEHSAEDTAFLLDLAKNLDLAVSSGSDYHGGTKPGVALGSGRDNIHTGLDVLEKMKQRRQNQGLPV